MTETKQVISTSGGAAACAACAGAGAANACGKCGLVRYCSKECQRKHWKGGHKTECKEPRREQSVLTAVASRVFKSVAEARPSLLLYRAKKGSTAVHWSGSERGRATWHRDVRSNAYPAEFLFPMSADVTCRTSVLNEQRLRPLFLGASESAAQLVKADLTALGKLTWKSVGERIDTLICGLYAASDGIREDALYRNAELVAMAHFGEISVEDVKAQTYASHKSWMDSKSWAGSDFLTAIAVTNPLWNVWERREATVETGGIKFLVSEITWGGAMQCPLQAATDRVYYGYDYGNKDWVITNLATKKRIWLPSLTVHMMLCHGGFCQGAACSHRIHPKQLVQVLFES